MEREEMEGWGEREEMEGWGERGDGERGDGGMEREKRL